MRIKTVLVIEDDLKNTKLMRILLERGKYRVINATEAKEGIRLAREQKPVLILMDIQLPGMDGISATRLIKDDPALKRIPVVAVSSYAMEEDIEKAVKAGCSGYLTKPINVQTFLDRIKDFVMKNRKRKKSPKKALTGKGKKILIVDDNPLNVKLLAGKLSKEGYATISAYNGEEAMEKVVGDQPDLILLDLMMPVVDGFEVIERLKSDSRTRDIHLIVITALSDDKELDRILNVADEILSKPVNTAELLMRVKSLLLLKDLRKHLQLEYNSAHYHMVPRVEAGPLPKKNKPAHILLVEDEEKDVKLIQNFLSGTPYELSVAENAREAFSKLERGDVDLIVLDIILPDMYGLEICRQLKASKATRDIQIIAVTNVRDLEEKRKSFEMGIDEYLVKPINKQELGMRIKALLKRKTNLEALQATMSEEVETLT
jgi:two-component system cell cycle response regulator